MLEQAYMLEKGVKKAFKLQTKFWMANKIALQPSRFSLRAYTMKKEILLLVDVQWNGERWCYVKM